MLFSYYRRPLFLLLLAYAVGIFLFRGHFFKPEAVFPFPLPRSGALIEGRVLEYPAAVPGGARFALETQTLYGRPFRAKLMVYTRSAPAASYGDKVVFLADLETPPGASVPGGLDWADYLARRGMAAQARAADLEVTGGPNAFIRQARRFRSAALAAFERALPPEEASVLGGVVLGEKRSVPSDLKTAFQDSGAMHLLVASGSNVGFVVAVVFFLCTRFGLKREHSGFAALGLAGFYVVAAGFDAPLVRAYLMFSAGLGAWLLRREAGTFHALTAACLLILLFSPRALFDAGFQMSFLAAYGLCVGMSLWGGYIKKRGLLGAALGLLMVSLFAQLGLYPLLALYFHKISLISPVSNMLLVPASGAAMALGFLLTLFSGAGFLFKPLAFACGVFMGLFLKTVRVFAGLPFSAVYVAEPSLWFTAGFFVLAFALLHAPLLGFRKPRLYAALAAGLVIMAGSFPRAPAPPAAVELFGDSNTHSVFLRDASGGLYMVNPGLNGKKLSDAVLAGGGKTVEAVLLTSLEEKNFSGLEKLAAAVRIRSVLLPYGPRPGSLTRLLSALEKKGCEVRAVWPGARPPGAAPAFWDGPGEGYTGRGDIIGWEIAGLRIGGEGAYVEESGADPELRLEAEPGRIVKRELPEPVRR